MHAKISVKHGCSIVYVRPRFQPLYPPLPLQTSPMSATTGGKLRKSAPRKSSSQNIPSIHWLFRSNIPRRRASYLAPDIRKRNFFGMGEIIGVLTNPAETVRSLTESRKLLEEARQEIKDNRERSQLRTKHTFSRLPGFFPRKAEMLAIERALEGEPSFTVLFGASSVGKTALLREVLSRDKYHVLHFDLRIAGFADLASLYLSLSQQMEQYFQEIATKMEGFETFEKEAWGFKHDRLNVERRLAEQGAEQKSQGVKTSDIARLMELFQSSLLKYWEFQPASSGGDGNEEGEKGGQRATRRSASTDTRTSNNTHVEQGSVSDFKSKSRWGFRSWGKGKGSPGSSRMPEQRTSETESPQVEKGKEKEKEERPPKRMPVIFFDESHKLPALIQSTETMKCLLDSMLVLTKQDRLCHVIHATSDPFYQTWLRQLNVMQHCKIITVGDCSRAETRKFFRDRMLPRVPERIRPGLNFEHLYDAFGGKLAHWHDYVTDYVNSNGTLDVKQCSHFLQAHALLNLHIIHSSQALTGGPPGRDGESTTAQAPASTAETLHPGVAPSGFRIYSPVTHPYGPGSMADGQDSTNGLSTTPDFAAMELLKVMSRLARPDTPYLPYFNLCRELGVRAVDGMVKGRVLDLRWTETVTKEILGEDTSRGNSSVLPSAGVAGMSPVAGGSSVGLQAGYLPLDPPPPIDDDDGMEPFSEPDVTRIHQPPNVYEEIMEVVGPKLVPTTPIMRFAMREVVQEYEDDQSVSEYASLSDVDEY
ncbi:hypothetical protein D9619_009745 [Psilocybe cf. subviscida]|uniref:AAA+ ATPase domain-containing protein n=1 Tax=Psilocybe cf. subviscida TaxID=2480587 RepID=A0A8H5F6F6_9AGAR|nr:hypothetical protein D9619_009745 [Psilocybe cf. subviscida]